MRRARISAFRATSRPERSTGGVLGPERLHFHVGEPAATSEEAGENQRFSRDVETGEIHAGVGLRITAGDRASKRVGESDAASDFSQQISERSRRTAFDGKD